MRTHLDVAAVAGEGVRQGLRRFELPLPAALFRRWLPFSRSSPTSSPLPSPTTVSASAAASAASSDFTAASSASTSSAFAAGVDNRVAFGQRWPLALLTGLDGPLDMRAYAAGSAVAALTLTLPAELALGVALGTRPRVVRLLATAVALAQLCRFGPLWYAVARAVEQEVRERIAEDKR